MSIIGYYQGDLVVRRGAEKAELRREKNNKKSGFYLYFMDSRWRFKDSISIETTNSFGQAQFTAPSIIHSRYNKTYTIYATKVGYITNEKNITIVNIPNLLIKEEIRSEYKRDERVTFTVIDNSSKPIANATIKFNDSTYYSDEKGKVTITIPPEYGMYTLIITKEGYATYIVDISTEVYKDYSILLGFICYAVFFVAIIVVVIIIILLLYKDRERIM